MWQFAVRKEPGSCGLRRTGSEPSPSLSLRERGACRVQDPQIPLFPTALPSRAPLPAAPGATFLLGCSHSAAVTSSCRNRGFSERGTLRRTLATGIRHPGRDRGSSAVLEAYVYLLLSARGWLTPEGLCGSLLLGDARLCSSTKCCAHR